MTRVAVIVVAHGEAETAGFFDNFSMTRHTLDHASEVMSIPKPLQLLISVVSGLKNSSRFRRIDYASPQNELTRKQAAAIGQKLMLHPETGGLEFEVFPAFSATPPFFEEIITDTRHYDAQIMFYMAPVENSLNCGSICGFLKKNHTRGDLAATKVIGRFWEDHGLVDLYLDHIFRCKALPAGGEARRTALVLAFHGTLVADAHGNAPSFHTGLQETLAFAGSLEKAVKNDARNFYGQVYTAFLNHDVGGEWSTPSLEQTLERLREENTEHVSLFSAGFFSDGNETLLKAKQDLMGSGIDDTCTIPCVNDSDAFAGYLAERIVRAAKQVAILTGLSGKEKR